MENLAQFEADLWEAADNLRANSKLTSSDYFIRIAKMNLAVHGLEGKIAEAKPGRNDPCPCGSRRVHTPSRWSSGWSGCSNLWRR